eukprot:Filipodium_phascolosomae@DN65_c0_g1_i1.p1
MAEISEEELEQTIAKLEDKAISFKSINKETQNMLKESNLDTFQMAEISEEELEQTIAKLEDKAISFKSINKDTQNTAIYEKIQFGDSSGKKENEHQQADTVGVTTGQNGADDISVNEKPEWKINPTPSISAASYTESVEGAAPDAVIAATNSTFDANTTTIPIAGDHQKTLEEVKNFPIEKLDLETLKELKELLARGKVIAF